MMICHVLLIVPYCILGLILRCKQFEKVKKWKISLHKHLFWAGTLRFYMEIYTDLVLCSLLNMIHNREHIEWGVHLVELQMPVSKDEQS